MRASVYTASVSALVLAACGDISAVQKNSPVNPYKDYRGDRMAVVGVGDPIQDAAKADQKISLQGQYSLGDVMDKVAKTYGLSIRWENGVHRSHRANVSLSGASFDEVRSYVEAAYRLRITREGERRLAVRLAANEPRIRQFDPGYNVMLGQVLRGLADQCGYNLVVTESDPALSKTRITTSFKNMSCSEAFETVLAPQGLSLLNQGGRYEIGGLPQRTWALDLHEPARDETQDVSFSSSSANTAGGGGNSGSTSSSGSSSGSSDGSFESGGSAKTTITESRNLWGELQADLSELIQKSCPAAAAAGDSTLSSGATASAAPGSTSDLLPPPSSPAGISPSFAPMGQASSSTDVAGVSGAAPSSNAPASCGYVRVNRTVGVVEMKAPQNVLDEADDIIRRVQDIASRRLLVEARLIAVSRDRGYDQGGTFKYGQKEGGNVYGGGFTPSISDLSGSVTSNLLALSNNGTGGYAGVKGPSIDALLKAAENFGTTYQLMQPTIEVMDRQRAILIDGRNERYFLREGQTESTQAGTLTSIKANERVQFVGVQFAVSAQIAEAGEPHTVSLQIPITDVSRFTNVTQVFNGESFTDSVPIATTRVIDEKVRIRDGEVKVIGGLTRTLAVDRESGIPLIREAPVAGKLFNEEKITYENVEFVVLLQVRRIY